MRHAERQVGRRHGGRERAGRAAPGCLARHSQRVHARAHVQRHAAHLCAHGVAQRAELPHQPLAGGVVVAGGDGVPHVRPLQLLSRLQQRVQVCTRQGGAQSAAVRREGGGRRAQPRRSSERACGAGGSLAGHRPAWLSSGPRSCLVVYLSSRESRLASPVFIAAACRPPRGSLGGGSEQAAAASGGGEQRQRRAAAGPPMALRRKQRHCSDAPPRAGRLGWQGRPRAHRWCSACLCWSRPA